MKLNYREKVVLAIVLAVAILLAGFFAIVKPKNDQIKAEKKTLSGLKTTEKEIRGKIDQIEPLKETINNIVKDTNAITENFVPREKIDNPVKLDEFMMDFANKNKIAIKKLAVGDMTETSLGYYYIAVKDIGANLRDLADFTGDYQKDVDKEMAEQNQLTERDTTKVLQQTYAIEAVGTKEDLWKYMDAINDYKGTLLITDVKYELADDDDTKHEDNEGENNNNNNDEDEKKEITPEDDVKVSITVVLYSVYDLKTPNYN